MSILQLLWIRSLGEFLLKGILSDVMGVLERGDGGLVDGGGAVGGFSHDFFLLGSSVFLSWDCRIVELLE